MPGSSSTALSWPSWLPIQISQFGISWDNFQTDPTDFTLSLSASVTGLYNLPLQVTGSIQDIKIDIAKLVAGQFPIVGLGAASVNIKGNLFGGSVDAGLTVGIANFESFLERTESYRRDLRRVEYGDERDPAMREFLTRISPVANAQRIAKPLLVAHGSNDPRVPYTEAEQIVKTLEARDVPVWYILADNEGHGFARKDNADFYFAAAVKFLQDVLRTE
jgi:pimeloyl-ACP methyl ester carboxylesterase